VNVFWRKFLTGLLILVPAWATLIILATLVSTVNSAIADLLNNLGISAKPMIGLGIFFILVMVTGMIATHMLGRRLLDSTERWIDNIPFVRSIYLTLKGMADLFQFRSRFGRSTVVAFPFPRDGVWALGFVMGAAPAPLQVDQADNLMMIFVPTAIHPFTGFLAFVPHRQLHPLNLLPEDAMKMEFSAGFYQPGADWLGAPRMSA